MSEDEKESVKRKLNRLLTRANYEILYDNLTDLSAIYEKSKDAAETMRDIKSGDYVGALSPKAESIVRLFAYLGLVESLGVTLIDMVLFLLIANGEEMHIYGDRGIKHVSALKELRKLDLIYKLYFLKSHGLGFFGKSIDRNIRNEVAHIKFSVEEDGTIRDSNRQEINIGNYIDSFWNSVSEITSIFDETKFMKLIEQGAREVREPND